MTEQDTVGVDRLTRELENTQDKAELVQNVATALESRIRAREDSITEVEVTIEEVGHRERP